MQEYMKLLGFLVKDKVTSKEGVVTSISFDLYGCIQAIVQPLDGSESKWFDLKRLVQVGEAPVMELPDFVNVPGGNELPMYPQQPL